MAKEMSPREEKKFDDVGTRGVDALRRASNGWKEIISGKRKTTRQSVMNENRQKESSGQENNWKPGDDDNPSDEVSMKKLMESHKKMQRRNSQIYVFENTDKLVLLKLCQLFEEHNPEIVSIEESGFNTYKLKYII